MSANLADDRRLENKENISVIWCDTQMMENPRRSETYKRRLCEINNYIQFFVVEKECITYIESVQDERIIFITSGRGAATVLPTVARLKQIDSIFIFCFQRSKYEHLKSKFPKIVNIFVDFESLLKSIADEIADATAQLHEYAILNNYQQAMRDLSTTSPGFHWFQLAKSIIMRLPRDQSSKADMLKACRDYYRNNSKELERINEFDMEYTSNNVIRWYTRQSFVYKLVNKALRCEDIQQLLRFRFFIVDLSTRLADEYKQTLQTVSNTFVVYRGVKLSEEQLQKFRENIGKLMATNGFWSTSKDYNRAVVFALKPTDQNDVCSVVFEITCDLNQPNTNGIFADISRLSQHPNEKEVLFDLSTCFQIDSIGFQESQKYWIIKLSIANAGENIAQSYLTQELTNNNNELMMGILLCDVGHYQSAEHLLKTLYKNPGEMNISLILLNIGRALYNQGKLVEAKEYYDKAYSQIKKTGPICEKNLVSVLINIGVLLRDQKKYEEAKYYCEEALQIQKRILSPSDISIVYTWTNLGNIFYDQEKYDEALKYYKDVLNKYEQARMIKHPGYAVSLNNIGNVNFIQGNYRDAQHNHQKALDIRKTLFPSDHPDIADSYNNLANVLYKQGKYNEALDLHIKARDIRQRTLPTEHLKNAESLNNIGSIFQIRKRYEEALRLHRQALDIQKNCLPSIHPDIALSLNNIGLILSKQNQYEEALESCKKALEIQKKCYTENHPSIALCYHSIGDILKSQEKYDKALAYFERAFDIRKQSLPENHPYIADSLHSIGYIQQKQGKYDEALKLYQQSLVIKEKTLPKDHLDVAITFYTIGQVFQLKNDLREAVQMFEEASRIRKKYLSENDPDLAEIYYRIGKIFEKLEQLANARLYLERALKIYRSLPNEESVRNTIQQDLQCISATILQNRA